MTKLSRRDEFFFRIIKMLNKAHRFYEHYIDAKELGILRVWLKNGHWEREWIELTDEKSIIGKLEKEQK